MEIQLRVVLLIIGLLILCGVAIDIYRRRPARNNAGEGPLNVINNNELLRSMAGTKTYARQQDPYQEDFIDDVGDVVAYTNPDLEDDYIYDDIESVSAVRIIKPAEYDTEVALESPKPVLTPSNKPDVAIPENVIVIHIMSRVRGGFDGEELYKAISNAHFYLGNNNIFYRHENDDGTGEALFSLVKTVEPGYFDIDLLPRQRVPGVTLILIPNKLKNPLIALDKLVRAAKQVAFVLNGELLDHTRQALTLTTIESYKQKIA
jgi:FtsZ-interacting cell division protein ZipA